MREKQRKDSDKEHVMNRRVFVKRMAALASTPLAVMPIESLLAASEHTPGKRLILIELKGANDGLNTLVPFQNDHYHRLRPTIKLAEKELLHLHQEMFMHTSMTDLMPLWEHGDLAWVQGLGYPDPNRSHFKSINLWESGGDGIRAGNSGWLTHDMQHGYSRTVNDAHGISMQGDLGVFRSESGRWISMSSTKQIQGMDVVMPNPDGEYNSSVDLVAARIHELDHTLTSLSKKVDKTKAVKPLSRNTLGKQLSHVVRLIRAGVDTPVYRVQLPGFDTHVYQRGTHARLLRHLSVSIRRLQSELSVDGEWDNTVVMTYSEFGRRAAENNASGTDHGTAAPHIVAGGGVHGGLFGTQPDLGHLVNGDPEHTLDYRALYERVIGDWFGINDNKFSEYRGPELNRLFG